MVEYQPRLKSFLAALEFLGTRVCKCVCDCPEGATASPTHMPNNVTTPAPRLCGTTSENTLWGKSICKYCGSFGKESACNSRDLGLIPRPGRSTGAGNDYPLQYSCPRNPMDRGAGGLQSMRLQELDTTKGLTLPLSLNHNAILFPKT